MGTMNAVAAPSAIEWAVAARTLGGESVSGDLHVVADFPGGALAGVVDGLGHGPEAAVAAEAAVTVLKRDAGALVSTLITTCHAALRRTRGVVMSLASFNSATNSVSWVGIGDVEAVLLRTGEADRRRESIILRGGVVGYQLPPFRETTHPVRKGDVLIFCTDGVRPDFISEVTNDREPQAIADEVLARYAKSTDDALVLVVRYRGAPA
jgi:negative regulator of sigma-B (phosphoserine phosphatase)